MFTDPAAIGPVMPIYREAYPEMRMVGVRRAWQDKRRLGEWHNERSELVARADLLLWRREAVQLRYEWMEGDETLQRSVELEMLHRPTATDRRVPDALCNGCGRVKPILYLKGGEWRCANCHGLIARASLLTAAEKMLVQARSLHTKVHEHGMPVRGFRTWDRNRLRLMMLMERLKTLGVTELREHLRAQVRGSWISAEETDEEELSPLPYRSPAPQPPRVAPWFG